MLSNILLGVYRQAVRFILGNQRQPGPLAGIPFEGNCILVVMSQATEEKKRSQLKLVRGQYRRYFDCWIVAYRAWGYAGLRMQYAVRRRKGFRHMFLWLSLLCTYQRFCCFHTLCRLAGYWFYGLCFVEFGSMDHGGSWKCLEC